jgi:hypothetical protein
MGGIISCFDSVTREEYVGTSHKGAAEKIGELSGDFKII